MTAQAEGVDQGRALAVRDEEHLRRSLAPQRGQQLEARDLAVRPDREQALPRAVYGDIVDVTVAQAVVAQHLEPALPHAEFEGARAVVHEDRAAQWVDRDAGGRGHARWEVVGGQVGAIARQQEAAILEGVGDLDPA